MVARGTAVPAIAILLSLLGLLPVIFFAFGAVGVIPETAERMLISLIDYAALILAFSGGVHWGLGLAPEAARPALRLGAGVLPLVIAWVGLVLSQFLSPSIALLLLIVGYLATVLTEHRAAQRLLVPPHYVWMRWGFSIVTVVMMVMVLVLRGVGQTIVF
ncbi:MAG: hypothetical protein QOG73_4954 [Acetobacteraceae bacterium]|jgi:hypothetical protein|nr:hypothetical protein [Acetobacteraceae bacterium]